MEKKEIVEFLTWLPESGIKEFKDKTPEECGMILDDVINQEGGKQIIANLTNMWKESKSKKSTLSGAADYLNTLRAEKGTKVRRKHGEYVGRIRHNDRWDLVRDEWIDNERIQEVENSFGDRIQLKTGIAGDSTLQALPVKYYEAVRKDAGYNPYVLDYETPDYKNAAAWTTRSGLEKVLDAVFMNRWSLDKWKDASDKYLPYFKNPYDKTK